MRPSDFSRWRRRRLAADVRVALGGAVVSSRLRRLGAAPALGLLLTAWLCTDLANALQPSLEAKGDSNAGYLTLSWTAPPSGACQLEEAAREDFTDSRVRYRGRHTSTVLSGLPDGFYYFRVRCQSEGEDWSQWSKGIPFEVRHHSMTRAGTLFVLGAFVFAATAIFVLRAKEEV